MRRSEEKERRVGENERGAKKDGPRGMETEMMMMVMMIVVDSQVQYSTHSTHRTANRALHV